MRFGRSIILIACPMLLFAVVAGEMRHARGQTSFDERRVRLKICSILGRKVASCPFDISIQGGALTIDSGSGGRRFPEITDERNATACLSSKDGAAPVVPDRGMAGMAKPFLYNRQIVKLIERGGVVDRAPVTTVHFRNFRVGPLQQIDWSVVDKAIFFEKIDFMAGLGTTGEGGDLPVSRHFRHVQFPKGIGIRDSYFAEGLHIDHASFGAFLEIRESQFQSSFDLLNSTIGGAVLFEGNRFCDMLRIENVRFGRGVNFARNRFVDPSRKPDREFDGTRESQLRMRETHIVDGLVLEHNDFFARDSVQGRSWPAFYGQKLVVEGSDILIDDNFFDQTVFFIDGDAKRLSVSNNRFSSLLAIENNNLFNISLFKNEYRGYLVIKGNIFSTYLWIDRDRYLKGFSGFEVSGNQINGDLLISPYNLPPMIVSSDASGTEVKRRPLLDLTYNRLRGPAEIYLPRLTSADFLTPVACGDMKSSEFEAAWPGMPWPGRIKLNGTVLDTQLNIRESCRWSDDYRLEQIVRLVDENGRTHRDFWLRDLSRTLDPRRPGCNRRIENWSGKRTTLDLSEARLAVLNIELPMSGCEWGWTGVGLEFDQLGDVYGREADRGFTGQDGRIGSAGGMAVNDIDVITDVVRAWRKILIGNDSRNSHDQYQILIMLADYLFSRGRLFEGRELKEEAKEIIYEPVSEWPGWPPIRRSFDLFREAGATGLDDGPADAANGQFCIGAGETVGSSPLWCWFKAARRWVVERVRYGALWPSSFGTNPEYAIMLLPLLILFAWWTLLSYHYGLWCVFHRPCAVLLKLYRDTRGYIRPGKTREDEGDPSSGFRDFRTWDRQRRKLESMPLSEFGDGRATRVQGFNAVDADDRGRGFSLLTYAFDVCLPAVSLGHYGVYSAQSRCVRAFVYVIHLAAWWLLTLFFLSTIFV